MAPRLKRSAKPPAKKKSAKPPRKSDAKSDAKPEHPLVGRVRAALARAPRVEEKRMFGGALFMVDGKMCMSAGPNRIMCRIDPAAHDEALKKKGVKTVVMRDRDYRGYVHVDAAALRTKPQLDYWVHLALEYNKVAKKSKKR